jgi:hypothetical protein
MSCNSTAVQKNQARFDVEKAEFYRFYVQHQICIIIPSTSAIEVPK